jgi:small subunit ribosomal protein S13
MLKKKYLSQLLLNYGLNKNLVFNLYDNLGLNTRVFASKFKRKHSSKLNQKIKNLLIGKKLKNKIKEIVNFSIVIKTFRGMRHKLRYPVRGQRTHTNAKTRKKNRL